MPDAEPRPHILTTPGGGRLVEFPISVLHYCGAKVPVAGGGYFRLFPYRFTRWALRKLNARRSEEHTSELQSHVNLVCRLLLEKPATHRALHSFPTRRSSDLNARCRAQAAHPDDPRRRSLGRISHIGAALLRRQGSGRGRRVLSAVPLSLHALGIAQAERAEIGRAHV